MDKNSKNTIIATALLSIVTTTLMANKLTMEEHTTQAMQQLQSIQNKSNSGTIVTVGDNVDCDFRLGTTRIQDAIDSGANEVRIAVFDNSENITISDTSVTLKGGYNTCEDAANNLSNDSIAGINGIEGSNLPTILINGNSQRNEVILDSLYIAGGEKSGGFYGGGITALGANLALNIKNSTIGVNKSYLGGGLSVQGGATDVVINDTAMFQNLADQGGAIYCSSGSSSVTIFESQPGASRVHSNYASGDGGGALIISGCTLTAYTGGGDINNVFGFHSNEAGINGGGFAIKNGGKLFLNGGTFCDGSCVGDNNTSASIILNFANRDENETGFGGGIYVTDVGSTVNLFNAEIAMNGAQSGGGIFAANGATVTISSSHTHGTCWSPGSCNQIYENATATQDFPTRGGAIYATSGAVIDISNTLIKNNQAGFGTALYTLAESGDTEVTQLNIEGSLIVNNGDDGTSDFFNDDTIRISGGKVSIGFSTLADNDIGDTANISNNGELNLFSSIIHNSDGGDVYSGFGSLTHDCLMVNETSTLPASTATILDDPEFVDRINGDFHLNANISPAIDFCDTFFNTPNFNDSDNEPRGYDDPAATNFLGSIDVGYDETYENDIIFKNGLE